MKDLSLVTTTELLEEVSNRVDAYLFIGYQDRSSRSFALMTEFKGNSLEVIGLSEMLKDRVREVISGNREGEVEE